MTALSAVLGFCYCAAAGATAPSSGVDESKKCQQLSNARTLELNSPDLAWPAFPAKRNPKRGHPMPLLTFHVGDHWASTRVRALLDATHAAVVEAFEVPERDRYQIVSRHTKDEWVVQDTGLGIDRSADVVIVQVVSRHRTQAQKEKFYAIAAERIERQCGVRSTDLVCRSSRTRIRIGLSVTAGHSS
jgi:hypothetical protein